MGHKSARGLHRSDVTHILSKVSCFFFIETLSFSQVTETIVFFPRANLCISNVTQQCRCSPMLIFRDWASCGLSGS